MGDARADDRGVLLSCPSCGRTNRLAFDHLHQPGRCGSCKTTLERPDTPVPVESSGDFNSLIGKASVPVVVDFWAPWCGPCRMVAPELEKVARALRGHVLVVKVNTDELSDVGARHRIQSIPTLAVFIEGREAGRVAGARPAAAIQAFIEQTVGART